MISIVLNIIITVAQVVGGLISGSLSLLSDALHNFSDVLSLIISYIANKLSAREASVSKTFGYKRAEIIAAFINASSLMVIAIILIKEAVERYFNPQSIDSTMVIWLAILAIAGNGFSVLLMKADSKTNMNMRSAYLHLVTDMLASVAVLIGGLLMKYYQLFWIDSVLTAGIAIYLIVVGYDLLKSSFNVLMLFTPSDIVIKDIVEAVCEIEEIKNIHHIHIWQLNEKEVHLEAHVEFHKNISISEFDSILTKIEKVANDEFNINHINIQPEFNKEDPKDIIVQD
ncbi:cation diffusion facilitator family transporter [Mesonia sp. MT50]|uniref:Cation diffusion facilitator family transporter n=1 Tax=Mesonia profundi TaxID=3070998 RepID=A0ABU0ZYG3_9FLAO|nr:cation diffusion facilitator family transporter [Mesonia profundi]MDQ7916505.1 cation diffusion facilitator family transporter [Mesonia profundi]